MKINIFSKQCKTLTLLFFIVGSCAGSYAASLTRPATKKVCLTYCQTLKKIEYALFVEPSVGSDLERQFNEKMKGFNNRFKKEIVPLGVDSKIVFESGALGGFAPDLYRYREEYHAVYVILSRDACDKNSLKMQIIGRVRDAFTIRTDVCLNDNVQCLSKKLDEIFTSDIVEGIQDLNINAID